MSDEAVMMAEFAANRSEAAFEAILRLHGKLVFATAWRQLGDRGLAEEVMQSVFVALAEQMPSLRSDRTLAGWLYRTTLNQARQRWRAEWRRRQREEVAAALAAGACEGETAWEALIPLLDEALLTLRDNDRLAVMLHFMEGRPFREVGLILKIGEEAARKRVQRSVDGLARWFRSQGVAVPAAALIGALSLEGIQAAPLSAAAVLALAGAGAVATAGSGLSILGILMTSTQAKIAMGLAAVVLLTTAPFVWRQKGGMNRAEPDTGLKSAPAAPVANVPDSPPVVRAAGPVDGAAPGAEKTFLERVNEDASLSLLSREEADAFVALNKTNAASLIAAHRVTHDLDYLRRAATNFPGDPAVLLRVAAHDAFPENRREWLDRFKAADPGNALADYLSASRYWKENQPDAALRDLAAASQKTAFNDYVTDHMQTLEEIYLSAGHSAAEAKGLATFAVELPHVSEVVGLSRNLVDLIKRDQSAGDPAAAENDARMGLALARHLNGVQDGGNLLGQIVGVAVEQRLLGALDPNQAYSFVNSSVGERLSELSAREQSIKQDSQFIGGWIARASEAEALSYFDRLKLYGESAAIQWLRNRSPQP